MNNEVVFNEIETIKVTIYQNPNYHCPIFKVESNNQCTNVSEIIEDTLKLY